MGCGLGAITRRILSSPGVESLLAVDLEPSYLERVSSEVKDSRLRLACSSAEEFACEEGWYDRAVSVNVLEHVKDDQAALAVLARALRPGGECAILVPAHPALYSPLDEGLSHHRRYTRRALRELAGRAGLEPRRIVHWNPLGALGWWLNGRLLKRKALPPRQVALYSRFGLRLSIWLDRLNPLPLGLSLIARLVKP
jgi:SAM-dependent methyltransferase